MLFFILDYQLILFLIVSLSISIYLLSLYNFFFSNVEINFIHS